MSDVQNVRVEPFVQSFSLEQMQRELALHGAQHPKSLVEWLEDALLLLLAVDLMLLAVLMLVVIL